MSIRKKADLSDIIGAAGGSQRRQAKTILAARPIDDTEEAVRSTPAISVKPVPASRAGLVPLTVNFPPEVRDLVKIIAVKKRARVQDVVAEALNDYFEKCGEPAIAPRGRM
jgi:hypothetical protein